MKLNATVGVIAFGLTVSLAWKVTANNPTNFGDPFPNLTTAQLNKFDVGKDKLVEEGSEQGQVNDRGMRTAPLSGLRMRKTLLYDARAADASAAILAHDGQGAKARQKFKSLSAKEVIGLLAFLSSL
jgi:CxxC motif-containing protein (DUF1111 family)